MPRKKQHSPEKIDEIVRLMHLDNSVDAPADSILWVNNLARGRVKERKQSPLQKLLAVLKIDLTAGTPAFGERSGARATARQMLFEAGDHAIDIRITRDDKSSSLHGQVLGTGLIGARVKVENAAESFKTVLNEFGEFRITAIPNGLYTLRILTENLEIIAADVDLR